MLMLSMQNLGYGDDFRACYGLGINRLPCESLKHISTPQPHLPQPYRPSVGNLMASKYFVFMNFDPEYERLRADRTKQGSLELDSYLSKKHDELLATTLEPGTYKKALSLVIVDGFAVEITDDQANVLRSANGVRVVEKNQELA
ncbi:Peptidase S8 propeptide/proteinase inhibitor I9 [Dillenia turbinata]|uniref:Peptidase S8 propeptide/proteinase inhibitor I9 n=1 Tax=Dillenia turbinata TaxID=194707 RepID=A0AAN8WKL9_9MAGN